MTDSASVLKCEPGCCLISRYPRLIKWTLCNPTASVKYQCKPQKKKQTVIQEGALKKKLQHFRQENWIRSHLVKSFGTKKCLTTEATRTAPHRGRTVLHGPADEFFVRWPCREGERVWICRKLTPKTILSTFLPCICIKTNTVYKEYINICSFKPRFRMHAKTWMNFAIFIPPCYGWHKITGWLYFQTFHVPKQHDLFTSFFKEQQIEKARRHWVRLRHAWWWRILSTEVTSDTAPRICQLDLIRCKMSPRS